MTWTYHGERRTGPANGYEHRWTTEDPAGETIVFVVLTERRGLAEAEAIEECRRKREERLATALAASAR